ncbi:MAG: phosphotransferase [Eubacteriales bacterium]
MEFNTAKQILDHFQIDGELIYCKPYGEGHINTTYMVCFLHETTPPVRYILQEINTNIFQNPEALIENISLVTNYIKEEIKKDGGNVNRETLSLMPSKSGEFYVNVDSHYYRVYNFIEYATCYQQATPELFYASAKAFGKFAKQLDGFDASLIEDTIKNFHNTVSRFNNFSIALENNSCNRAEEASEEISFIKSRESFCSIVLDEIENGAIPLRVCHNDTKLNNVMIDNASQEGICVIDLDTVMQGSLLYDFGDSIRFGASSAAEDEENLESVYCDLAKFDLYVKGYLEECHSILSPKELELLPHAAMLMTFECGMRFLTDYLEGDTYFRVHKPKHNLLRARNQFKLVADMEMKLEEMSMITQKHFSNYR